MTLRTPVIITVLLVVPSATSLVMRPVDVPRGIAEAV